MGHYNHFPEVKITQSGILINNLYLISYHNKDGWLDIYYNNLYNNKQCLTFRIVRSTSKYQFFNVLIPVSQLKEKEQTIDLINKYRVYKDYES